MRLWVNVYLQLLLQTVTMRGMNLLTGHQGYIGSELSGILPSLQVCDLRAGRDYRRIRGGHYDCVVHLAASVSVMESFEQRDHYFENNCYGLRDFLRNNFVKRIVFISTGGALYGNRHMAAEPDASLDQCISPYAQSKFMAEQVVRSHVKNHCILRLANVIGGSPQRRGEASCEFHFMRDNPIKVYGGGQTRDFIDIALVAGAIKKAAEDETITGTFNIGSGTETDVLKWAESFGEQRGVAVDILPPRPGELDYISLDITKAKAAGLL